MEKTKVTNRNSQVALIAKAVWPSLVLFVVAGAAIWAGFYIKSGPEWLQPNAIREHNRGVATYDELLWGPLITSEESLMSTYPHVIEKAGERFEKAGADGADRKVKSAALYNLGTLIGRVAFFSQPLPGIDVSVAVVKLSEALREDPTNEDAKYNLELLERKLTRDTIDASAPGLGYGAGAVNKGY